MTDVRHGATAAPLGASAPAVTEHVDALRAALDGFGPAMEVANRWGQALAVALPAGARLFAAGNGGSAAQAQHLTAEIVGRYRDDRRPFSAVALHAETATLTAIANDYGLDEIYARQIEAHGRPGDIAVFMSTSGRSSNIVAAARRAHACGVRSWAMTGATPNPLADVSDEVLEVRAPTMATVQELHLVALHLVCASFDRALADTLEDAGGPAW